MSKRAAIAIGSNLGDRLGNLQIARDRIRTLEGVTLPAVQSAVYETSPVDCEAGAPKFYNAVIEIGFQKSADELFEALQRIERTLGRNRDTPSPHSSPSGREAPGEGMQKRNVSRTIDLDLLYFGSEERTEPPLQLPHPRMTGRKFVLQPLCDIAPDLRLPGQTKNVGELLAELPEQGRITRLMDTW
jgi:2-amino-4-hydroxy-6-hydroxymethyldihydropteridine diphosphokinase